MRKTSGIAWSESRRLPLVAFATPASAPRYTLGTMAVKPDGPPASEPASHDARGGPAEDSQDFGPLRLVRRVKADGRALILYSRAERPRA